MSTISQLTTAVDGNTITSAVWNNEWANILNDYNGGITNANIAANAAIAASKLAFSGTSGQVLHSDGSGGLTYSAVTVNRGFTWGIKGTLTVADEQGMKYIVPQSMTVSKIWAKTGSGTCTIRVQRDTTDVDTSFAVTSSVGSETSFDSATLTAGEVLTLDITAISSGVDLFVHLECTQ